MRKATVTYEETNFGDRLRRGCSFYSKNEEYLLGVKNEKLYGGELDESVIRREAEHVTAASVFETFESVFEPSEMRCLALVAHNHMKPAMQSFVEQRRELLKKFRLTGTNTTMTMINSVLGDETGSIVYGPSFKSGPLGGDSEVCALMCQEDLGGVFFFMDPLDAHPHQCDIDALVRLANVQNVLLMTNPTSAHAVCYVLEQALREGRKDMIPSFFLTLESPGVKVYKERQEKLGEKT